MARNNYKFEKRKRELAKQKKREEKRQRKLAKKQEALEAESGVPAEDIVEGQEQPVDATEPEAEAETEEEQL